MSVSNGLLVRVASVPILIGFMFAVGASAPSGAQDFTVSSLYPDIPSPRVPSVGATMKAPVQATSTFRHRWLTLNNGSIATLVVGAAIDSWGTYKNMTHVKWICGDSPAFAGGYDTNAPGEISSLDDVQGVCGVGPTGQSANWSFDTTRVGYFSEGGWATQFHVAGDRNYAAVEGWNIANDIGWYLFARHLGKRTDWMRRGGPSLNFGRGVIHLSLGVGNFIAVNHHQNPNTLDLHVPVNSNYRSSPRWWGKK